MLVYQRVVTVVQPEVSMKLKGFLTHLIELTIKLTQGTGESMIDMLIDHWTLPENAKKT